MADEEPQRIECEDEVDLSEEMIYIALYPNRKHAEEWIEEDFGRAVAEGMTNAGDDEHEAVEVEILNHRRGEVVGT